MRDNGVWRRRTNYRTRRTHFITLTLPFAAHTTAGPRPAQIFGGRTYMLGGGSFGGLSAVHRLDRKPRMEATASLPTALFRGTSDDWQDMDVRSHEDVWVGARSGLLRFTFNGSAWAQTAYGGGVTEIVGVAVSNDGATVYASTASDTASGVYALDVATGAWVNGGAPILTAAPGTQFRGVAAAAVVASSTPTPTPSRSPTPSPTASASGSASATPPPTASITPGGTPSPTSSEVRPPATAGVEGGVSLDWLPPPLPNRARRLRSRVLSSLFHAQTPSTTATPSASATVTGTRSPTITLSATRSGTGTPTETRSNNVRTRRGARRKAHRWGVEY